MGFWIAFWIAFWMLFWMGLWIGLDGNWDWFVFGCCFDLVDVRMGFAFWLGGTYYSPDSTCLLRVLPCGRKFSGIGKDT